MSRMSEPGAVATACQFIQPGYPTSKARVRGRGPDRKDTLHFGPYRHMLSRRVAPARPDATVTADPWRPVPVLVTRATELPHARQTITPTVVPAKESTHA